MVSAMTRQIEIFPEDVCASFHHDNAESRKAFDELLPKLGVLQEKVLQYADGVSDGITVKSVRHHLNMEHQTASARLTELKQMELISQTEKRRDGCRVLQITELGRRTLQAWQKRN